MLENVVDVDSVLDTHDEALGDQVSHIRGQSPPGNHKPTPTGEGENLLLWVDVAP